MTRSNRVGQERGLPGPLGGLVEKSGPWSLLIVVLGLWLLEAVYYAVLAADVHGIGLSARGLLLYLRLAAAGAPLAVLRWLFYMGGLWLSAWLFGARGLDGRRALVAASYTAVSHTVSALVLAALYAVLGLEPTSTLIALSYYGSMIVVSALLLWATCSVLGYNVRGVLAAILAVLLVNLTPAAALTPGFNAYASLSYLIAGSGAGAANTTTVGQG